VKDGNDEVTMKLQNPLGTAILSCVKQLSLSVKWKKLNDYIITSNEMELQ
jgi:hypothetical protein